MCKRLLFWRPNDNRGTRGHTARMEIKRTDKQCPHCHVPLFRAVSDTDELFCLQCGAGGPTVSIVEEGAGLTANWVSAENLEVIRRVVSEE